MITLSQLKNTHRKEVPRMRVGRGPGSKGKTCGRGTKGQGARSGARKRHTYEGGQFRLFMKLPTKGFTRGRFQKKLDSINLSQIDKLYEDGEVVNMSTLHKHGYISGTSNGIKILADGELKKKVKIEADAYSESAKQKLTEAKVEFVVVKK